MIRKFVGRSNLALYFLAIMVTWLEAIIRPTLVAMIVSSFEQENLSHLWSALVLGIFGNLILLVGLLGKRFYYAKLIQDFRRGFKQVLFARFLESDTISADEILSDLENDVQQLETNYVEATVIILSSLGFTTVSIFYALWTNFYLGLVFIVFYAIPALFSSFGARRLDAFSEKKSQTYQSFLSKVSNYILGQRIIRNYQVERGFEARFGQALEENLAQELAYEKQRTWNSLVINGVDIVCSIAPLIAGGFMTYYGWVSAAGFVAIYLVSYNIGYQFQELSYFLNTRRSTESLRDKYEPLFQEEQFTELKAVENFYPIVFDKVSFVYGERQILENFSLMISEGEKIALIGESGSGKTTVLNLLFGDLQPTSGRILFAGRELSPSQIRQQATYILQQHHLFSDLTLQENIALSASYDEVKMHQILEATKLSHLSDDSQNLSGGEGQRVEIARSLYHGKSLILADEVKSNLDRKTAQAIDEILHKIPQTLVEVIHHYTPESLAQYDQVIEIGQKKS